MTTLWIALGPRHTRKTIRALNGLFDPVDFLAGYKVTALAEKRGVRYVGSLRKELNEVGLRLMLDLKFVGPPDETAERAAIWAPHVDVMTVAAFDPDCGDRVRAACRAIADAQASTIVAAVMDLTSNSVPFANLRQRCEHVLDAGAQFLIMPYTRVRNEFGTFSAELPQARVACPGIRYYYAGVNDHIQVGTPVLCRAARVDIIMGRPIHADPRRAFVELCSALNKPRIV